ncbi:DUF1269 domain-containing protein [Bdellovibrio sp. HCB337]|uniref:DUF1269 domain-containing protein n=1 Tax=Bdellovibrio sp. HCB337 TaxID=3394358 RepID=UPI0039A57A2E
MSTIIAIVYPNKDVAEEVYETVNRLQSMGLLDLIDACVAEKKENGKVKLQQAFNLPLIGAANGIFLGALVGLFFMVPGIGAVAGAIAGSLSGALTDVGLNDSFMKDLSSEVDAGNTVLFLYVRDATVDRAIPEVGRHGGRILYTSLSGDQEKKLQELFSGEDYRRSPELQL